MLIFGQGKVCDIDEHLHAVQKDDKSGIRDRESSSSPHRGGGHAYQYPHINSWGVRSRTPDAHDEGVPIIGYRDARGQKTKLMGLPSRERSLTISSAVWIQYTNVTDRRTLGDSKDRAYAYA